MFVQRNAQAIPKRHRAAQLAEAVSAELSEGVCKRHSHKQKPQRVRAAEPRGWRRALKAPGEEGRCVGASSPAGLGGRAAPGGARGPLRASARGPGTAAFSSLRARACGSTRHEPAARRPGQRAGGGRGGGSGAGRARARRRGRPGRVPEQAPGGARPTQCGPPIPRAADPPRARPRRRAPPAPGQTPTWLERGGGEPAALPPEPAAPPRQHVGRPGRELGAGGRQVSAARGPGGGPGGGWRAPGTRGLGLGARPAGRGAARGPAAVPPSPGCGRRGSAGGRVPAVPRPACEPRNTACIRIAFCGGPSPRGRAGADRLMPSARQSPDSRPREPRHHR